MVQTLRILSENSLGQVKFHLRLYQRQLLRSFRSMFQVIRIFQQTDKDDAAELVFRSIHRRCSVKEGVPRNFAKFTGKQLCQALFFNKVAGLRLQRDSGRDVFQ